MICVSCLNDIEIENSKVDILSSYRGTCYACHTCTPWRNTLEEVFDDIQEDGMIEELI